MRVYSRWCVAGAAGAGATGLGKEKDGRGSRLGGGGGDEGGGVASREAGGGLGVAARPGPLDALTSLSQQVLVVVLLCPYALCYAPAPTLISPRASTAHSVLPTLPRFFLHLSQSLVCVCCWLSWRWCKIVEADASRRIDAPSHASLPLLPRLAINLHVTYNVWVCVWVVGEGRRSEARCGQQE